MRQRGVPGGHVRRAAAGPGLAVCAADPAVRAGAVRGGAGAGRAGRQSAGRRAGHRGEPGYAAAAGDGPAGPAGRPGAGALGAVGKPLLRVHTAGSVGGAVGIVAASLVQAGLHRRVLAVAFEKQSESNAMWALSITPPFSLPVVAPSDRRVRPAAVRRGGAAGDGPSGRAPRSVTPTAARSSSPCGGVKHATLRHRLL